MRVDGWKCGQCYRKEAIRSSEKAVKELGDECSGAPFVARVPFAWRIAPGGTLYFKIAD